MIRFIITTILFICIITVQQSNAQSLYMSENSLGFSGSFGIESNSANLSGTSFNFSFSPDRKVDFTVEYDRFSQPDFAGYQSDVSGSVVFYPKKQWADDLFTMQVFIKGANSTAPDREGFSATLGSAVSTQLDINTITSFFPRAGFLFVPFQPGSTSQYSAVTFDTSFTFKITPGVKFLVSPRYQYELGDSISGFALMGGIVL